MCITWCDLTHYYIYINYVLSSDVLHEAEALADCVMI
jgi:hypothetical protein